MVDLTRLSDDRLLALHSDLTGWGESLTGKYLEEVARRLALVDTELDIRHCMAIAEMENH